MVVVGGGPAGSAASVQLLRLGRSVILLERSGYDNPRLGELLSPSARPVLAELVLSESALTEPHGRSNGITMSWGGAAIRYSDYIFDPYGPGYHLDRCLFDRDLAGVVLRTGGTLLTRTRTESVARRGDDAWTVTTVTADGRAIRLSARFLVDATGRAALMGRSLGSHRRRFDRLIGVSGRHTPVPGRDCLGDRLLLESVETGWWYAMALPTKQAFVVFMTDADVLRERPAAISDLWQREFERTRLISAMLPALRKPTGVAVRPADTSVLEPMHGRSWTAVGEAGVAYDPLSGRGILDALESGLAAGTAIDRALDGNTVSLDEFARERRERFLGYLDQRREMYQQEQRWPTSRFWTNRHEDPYQGNAVVSRFSHRRYPGAG